VIHGENGNSKPKKTHTHVYIELFYTTLICTFKNIITSYNTRHLVQVLPP